MGEPVPFQTVRPGPETLYAPVEAVPRSGAWGVTTQTELASESHAMHAVGTCVQVCGVIRWVKGPAHQRLGHFRYAMGLELACVGNPRPAPMRVQDLYLRLRQLPVVSPNTYVYILSD
jgi:hypothetical protein